MDVKPFLHQHHLLFGFNTNSEATCNKCKEQFHIPNSVYNCESCHFWLHEACAEQQLPLQISHPFHSQHPLTLYNDALNFVCKGCFNLSRGHRYMCKDCNFIIEVLCASYTNDDALEKQECQRSDDRYKTIKHFIHGHSLSLFEYRKVRSDHYSCKWCDKFLSRISYGCFECWEEFFVHESCLLSIPAILKHPFHPRHPLYIQSKTILPNFRNTREKAYCNACRRTIEKNAYNCRECKFWLHFLCAKRQPSLRHEVHDHSLSYFQIKYSPIAYYCKICHQEICDNLRSNFYRCVQCNVNFHLSCVPIPPIIQHGNHRHALKFVNSLIEDISQEYYCDICEEERNQIYPLFCCEKCNYIAHIECAINKMDTKALIPKLKEQKETEEDNAESDESQLKIQHFNHEHPLKFYEVIEKNENLHCKACHVEVTGQAYGCESCKYYLHKTCAELSHEVLHPFHLQHPLRLIAIEEKFVCDECRDYTNGFNYVCYECDFKLDVKCATSTTPKNEIQSLKEIERDSKLCFFNQDHKLFFMNTRHLPDFKCAACSLPNLGPTYSCDYCSYHLHESCLGFPREIQLPFHQESTLHAVLVSDYNNDPCSACRGPFSKHIINYSFWQPRYSLNFHLQCANSLRRAIKFESHEHPFFYFGPECQKLFAHNGLLVKYIIFECNKCNKPFNGVPFYRCLTCVINLHLECVPIPDFIKSKCHIHPFILKDYFTEDDSGEYYCDVCEEERHAKDHVYYCKQCHGLFVAHVECVLKQVEGARPVAEAVSNLQLYFQKFCLQMFRRSLRNEEEQKRITTERKRDKRRKNWQKRREDERSLATSALRHHHNKHSEFFRF